MYPCFAGNSPRMSVDDLMTASNNLPARPLSPTQADTPDITRSETPDTEDTVIIPIPNTTGTMVDSQNFSEDDFASFEEVKQMLSQNSAAVAMVTEKEQSDGVSSSDEKITPAGDSSEVKEEAVGGSSTQVQDLTQQNRYSAGFIVCL